MKKFSAEPFFLAVAALTILPLQQLFLKKNSSEIKRIQEDSIHTDSVNALSEKTDAVIKMHRFCLQHNSQEAAAWLKFGSMELREPVIMLLYGDWLKAHGEIRRAGYFYRFALKKARQKPAGGQLIEELEKRLKNQ